MVGSINTADFRLSPSDSTLGILVTAVLAGVAAVDGAAASVAAGVLTASAMADAAGMLAYLKADLLSLSSSQVAYYLVSACTSMITTLL